jgi:adenylyltransferase/sulfurtransferase
MAEHTARICSLETHISNLESQLEALRNDLTAARRDASSPPSELPDAKLLRQTQSNTDRLDPFVAAAPKDGNLPDAYDLEILSALALPTHEPPDQWPLEHEEYKRYGRQLIMPEIGLPGQLRLKRAKVLVVGVGGLGCPAAMYLAGAGVGTLGLVDGDEVEESNLHRQVLHSSKRVGVSKVDSAIEALREYVCVSSVRSVGRELIFLQRLNPLVDYVPFKVHLAPENALEVFAQYDIVLDCTDNPATRYLISDMCVLLGKPLVSASALRTEGQLMVLNYPARPAGSSEGGPCYRCVFPKPPPVESVVTCGEGGILGPIVGVMGVLQALEAIKVITAEETSSNPSLPGLSSISTSSFAKSSLSPPTLLIFSGYSNPQFRSIKLRSRSLKCAACSDQATITLQVLLSGSMDYIQFCGVANPINILPPEERISAQQYAETRKNISLAAQQHRLIDVREKVQFDLAHLFGSINIPFSRLSALSTSAVDHDTVDLVDEIKEYVGHGCGDRVLVVCRLGNDSQIAVRKFKELGLDEGGKIWIGDVEGGLKAWREQVDHTFPDY